MLAEGNGEVGPNAQRGPGSLIAPVDWAPAHALFARAIAAKSTVPEAAVQFLEPLRTGRGAVAKGSNLLHQRTLRQLLSYLPASRPDLLILLVDADGVPSRKRELDAVVSDLPGTKLIAVAVNEFESWLVSDGAALATVLGVESSKAPHHPESLAPSVAKARLQELTDTVQDARRARLSLAQNVDLATLIARCPAFAKCLDELQTLLKR
ncbi:MAG: DUF4276 family protein [Archangium sp.]|nr:DUF4276 family protein [Archangium sp.]MDP3571344.1 DUF4276 family protein [Archangium sp.]